VIRGAGLLRSHAGKLASFYNSSLLMQEFYTSSTWKRWRGITVGGHLGVVVGVSGMTRGL